MICKSGRKGQKNMKEFENISTGDQIQFTDGTIWTCTLRGWGGDTDMVVFVPMSLKQLEEDGWCKDYFFPDDVKSILRDAIKGGAQIIKYN